MRVLGESMRVCKGSERGCVCVSGVSVGLCWGSECGRVLGGVSVGVCWGSKCGRVLGSECGRVLGE